VGEINPDSPWSACLMSVLKSLDLRRQDVPKRSIVRLLSACINVLDTQF